MAATKAPGQATDLRMAVKLTGWYRPLVGRCRVEGRVAIRVDKNKLPVVPNALPRGVASSHVSRWWDFS